MKKTEEERKEARRLYLIEYRLRIKDKKNEYNKKYREEKPEVAIYHREQYKKIGKDNISDYVKNNKELAKKKREDNIDVNKKKKSIYNKVYNELNKEKRNLKKRERRKNDLIFRLSLNIKNLIYNSLLKKNFRKNTRTQIIIDCTVEDFKKHLESKFESWMTWENYGLYNGTLNHGWDIDHIIPTASAITEEDVIKLNHYTNLQPLCSYTNRYIKRDNV